MSRSRWSRSLPLMMEADPPPRRMACTSQSARSAALALSSSAMASTYRCSSSVLWPSMRVRPQKEGLRVIKGKLSFITTGCSVVVSMFVSNLRITAMPRRGRQMPGPGAAPRRKKKTDCVERTRCRQSKPCSGLILPGACGFGKEKIRPLPVRCSRPQPPAQP